MQDESIYYPRPAHAGEFMMLLMTKGRLDKWRVESELGVTKFWIGAAEINAGEDLVVVYMGNEPPIVTDYHNIKFDLRNLFEEGSHWELSVFAGNPYMPARHKNFLCALRYLMMRPEWLQKLDMYDTEEKFYRHLSPLPPWCNPTKQPWEAPRDVPGGVK